MTKIYTMSMPKLTKKQRLQLRKKAGQSLYKRDKEGFLYADMTFKFRVSECCKAAVTIDQDTYETYCKGCYKVVSPELGMSPKL